MKDGKVSEETMEQIKKAIGNDVKVGVDLEKMFGKGYKAEMK